MKRGQTAALFAVILVAAVAAFVLFTESSTTGMYNAMYPDPVVKSAGCGNACTTSVDCFGSCGTCSLGKCVAQAYPNVPDIYDTENYHNCVIDCRNREARCLANAPTSAAKNECLRNRNDCYDSCGAHYARLA